MVTSTQASNKELKLNKSCKKDFDTLCCAVRNGDACLLSTRRKGSGEVVFLICARHYEGTDVVITPFAELIRENPVELYEDPTKC